MPANGKARGADWASWAGFNSYDIRPANGTFNQVNIGAQNDDRFHKYRFDWYADERVEFYVDDELQATITTDVPHSPAQLWVGNWPAPWSGSYNYATSRQYIDWVRITDLD
jgi:beta-glucanase (GH16 family)